MSDTYYDGAYTGEEIDAAVAAAFAAAPQSTTYTKTEVDTLLSAKAPQSTTYTKTEVDTLLSAKAPQSTTYTKNEVDTALSGKANTSDLGAAAAKGFDASPTSGHTDYAVSSDGVASALSNVLSIKGTFNSAADFNAVIEAGIWRYNGGPAHNPDNSTDSYGLLIVFINSNYFSQICHSFKSNKLFIRHSVNNGSTWSAWNTWS